MRELTVAAPRFAASTDPAGNADTTDRLVWEAAEGAGLVLPGSYSTAVASA